MILVSRIKEMTRGFKAGRIASFSFSVGGSEHFLCGSFWIWCPKSKATKILVRPQSQMGYGANMDVTPFLHHTEVKNYRAVHFDIIGRIFSLPTNINTLNRWSGIIAESKQDVSYRAADPKIERFVLCSVLAGCDSGRCQRQRGQPWQAIRLQHGKKPTRLQTWTFSKNLSFNGFKIFWTKINLQS